MLFYYQWFLITFPAFGIIFVEPDVSVENRSLTSWPNRGAGLQTKQYENYFVDRIAFRKELIQMSSWIDFLFLKNQLLML